MKKLGSNRSARWAPLGKEEVKVLLGITTEQRHPAMDLAFMSQVSSLYVQALRLGDMTVEYDIDNG